MPRKWRNSRDRITNSETLGFANISAGGMHERLKIRAQADIAPRSCEGADPMTDRRADEPHAPTRFATPSTTDNAFGNAAIRGIRCGRSTRVLHLVLRLVLHRAPRFSEGAAFPFVKPIAERGQR